MLRGGCCVRRDLGRQRERVVSTGDPCSQQEDRAHQTQHLGTSAMDYRILPKSSPSPGWLWAPLCLPGSKPALQFEAGCSHLRITAWAPGGVQSLKRCPKLPQGSSSSPGLSHGATQPWAPQHQHPQGSSLGLVRFWLGAEDELPPLLRHSRHSPSPANEPRAPA